MTANFIELSLLAAFWGASFLFMRIAAPDFGPVPLILLRVAIATLILLPVVKRADARAQIRKHAWPLLVVGATNAAVPFCLFAYATLYLNASFVAVLNATAPSWTALIAYLWLRKPLSVAQVTGLLLGIGGVALLVWDKLGAARNGSNGSLSAVAAVLGASCLYGFAANYAKRALGGVAPPVIAFGGQAASTALLILPGIALWPARLPAAQVWAAALGLGMMCTGLAFALFYRLIDRAGAEFAISVTFLTPVFGMIWGSLFLGEAITPAMLAGCAIILVGTAFAAGVLRLIPRTFLR